MKNRLFCTAALLFFVGVPRLAVAQEEPRAVEPSPFEDEIVVQGQRRQNVVVGDIEPELTLDARDIRSYGVSTIGELLEALAPQTSSGSGRRGGGGRPAVLLNGKRISGFREIRQYPPEAIARVDVLPEEVALKYGFRADQRVVNIVLRERFRALTAELEAGAATDGGRPRGEAEANYLRIREGRRWNIDIEIEHDAALFESEREILPTGSTDSDVIGNVTALTPGGEIDPALSALAGETVTIAGAPAAAADGPVTLSQFIANLANITDEQPFRTLQPRSDKASLAAAYSTTMFSDVSATATAALDFTQTEAALGLAEGDLILPTGSPFSPFSTDVNVARAFVAPGALGRRKNQWDSQIGFALNSGPDSALFGDWRWSVNGRLERVDEKTDTDRSLDIAALQGGVTAGSRNPFGPITANDFLLVTQRATTTWHNGLLEAVLYGEILELPAGALATTLKVGGEVTRLKSESDDQTTSGATRLSRDQGNAQINVDFPLLDAGDTPTPLGDVTFSANARVDALSDFDTLTTYGYSLSWRPISQIQLIASVTREKGPPDIGQLGDPLIATPNVRIFDFATGETVDNVTRITGGAPGLLSDDRRVFRLNLSAEPFDETNFRITASYTDQHTDNAISAFPALTPDIEAAFPDRFTRDAGGRLLEIDARPVNFAETDQRQVRYGFFWSKSLEQKRPELTEEERERLRNIFRRNRGGRDNNNNNQPAPTGAGNDAPPRQESGDGSPRQRSEGAGGGGRGFGGGGGGRFGGGRGGFGGGGRLQLSANHTIVLEDSVRISANAATLNLLNGDAIAANGGASRHLVDASFGYSKSGFGLRADAEWKSGASILDNGATSVVGAGDLYFADYGKVDIRLFLNPTERPKLLLKYPFLLGSRISLEVDNVFNTRQDVTDSTGATPLGYQPELLDPLGRTITLRFRKLIF